MDPVVCLDNATKHYNACDYNEALYALWDYFTWRLKGGFQPDGGDARALQLQRDIAEEVTSLTWDE